MHAGPGGAISWEGPGTRNWKRNPHTVQDSPVGPRSEVGASSRNHRLGRTLRLFSGESKASKSLETRLG